MSHVEDRDIGNFIDIKDHKKKMHSLVSEKEILNLKRLNYGDYYLKPSQMKEKLQKMENSLKEADGTFSRKIGQNGN